MLKAKFSVIILFTLLLSDAEAIVGNEWRQLPKVGKQAYTMGVMDSWHMLRVMKDAVKQTTPSVGDILAEISECTAGRFTYEQVIAIVEKFMTDNPTHWHYDMASLVLSALSPACKAYKKQ